MHWSHAASTSRGYRPLATAKRGPSPATTRLVDDSRTGASRSWSRTRKARSATTPRHAPACGERRLPPCGERSMKSSKSTDWTGPAKSRRRRRGATPNAVGQARTDAAEKLLIEGDTCWRLANASRAAVLIDAAAYFEALRASLLAAQRSVFILGWELHSRTRLEGGTRPADGAPSEIGKLLRWMLKRRPHLEVKILLWNHPVLYSVHRELFPRWIFGPRLPERVEIMLDSHLPVGASHHEKLVIIDDAIAYS